MFKPTPSHSLNKQGFCFLPRIFRSTKISTCRSALWEIINGNYETGVKPENRFWETGDNPNSLIKIDKPHLCNKTVWGFITDERFTRLLSEATSSKKIQIWHTQLVWKPTSKSSSGNAGWHRDAQYWPFWSKKGLYTAWIALSNVTENSGPVQYIVESNKWASIDGLDFFSKDLSSQHNIITKTHKDYKITKGILSEGQVAIHSSLTYHSSTANKNIEPRIGLVVHFCTDQARKIKLKNENKNYLDYLQNQKIAPIIFQ